MGPDSAQHEPPLSLTALSYDVYLQLSTLLQLYMSPIRSTLRSSGAAATQRVKLAWLSVSVPSCAAVMQRWEESWQACLGGPAARTVECRCAVVVLCSPDLGVVRPNRGQRRTGRGQRRTGRGQGRTDHGQSKPDVGA